jgi:hypothetical protein
LSLLEEALRLQSKLLRENPHDALISGDLFKSRLSSMLLDIHTGRKTAAERIDEIIHFVEGRRRLAEKDPQNIVAGSDAVLGCLAQAERSVADELPANALATLKTASAVLDPARQRSPRLLLFRALAVRLETLRGEVLRRLNKNEEAVAAAKQAISIAEPLADYDPAYLYDLACAQALQTRLDPSAPGPPEAAVEALETAVKGGFDNAYKLETDDRLAPLRCRQDFRALIGLLKKKTPMPRASSNAP